MGASWRGRSRHGKTGAGGGTLLYPAEQAPWKRVCYATPVRLLPLALEACLSDRAFWRNVPLPIWRDKLGYRLLEKWLSCWDWGLLGRALLVEEVACLTGVGRGIGGILGVQVGGTGK